MKKVVAILCIVLAMTMLTACQLETGVTETTKASANETTAGQDERTTEAEPELGLLDPYPETVTLTFSRLLDHASTYPEGVTNDNNGYVKMIKDVLNIECVTAFEAKSGEDYDRLTSLAVAGEDLPDVLYIYGDTALVKELYENEMIMSIEEIYETYAPDHIREAYDSYGDLIWKDVTFDGERYALPYCAGNWNNMIWIRTDWLDKLGIKIDEDGNEIISRDELVMVAKAFVDNDMSGTGNTIGLALKNSIDGNFSALTNHFNAFANLYLADDDGNVYHGSTTTEMKEALAWMANLYEQGILDPEYGVRTSSDIDTLLTNGQLGIFAGAWSFGSGRKSIHEMDPTAVFKSYSIDNGSGKANFPSSQIHKGQFIVIRKDCEHPEAVFKILAQLKAYNNLTAVEKEAQFPELYAQVSAGMAGQSRPVYIDILGATYIYENQAVPVLNYLKDGTITGTFDPETNSYMRAYNTFHADSTTMTSADWVLYISRFGGGAAHGNKLSTEGLYEMWSPIYDKVPSMTNNPVDLSGMCAEYFIKIITGELPLDAFDEYVTQRNAQGDEKILAELTELIK